MFHHTGAVLFDAYYVTAKPLDLRLDFLYRKLHIDSVVGFMEEFVIFGKYAHWLSGGELDEKIDTTLMSIPPAA